MRMMDEMMIRKKALKIQERLGMRIGISEGTIRYPVKNFSDAFKALEVVYRTGMKAFVLPHTLFKDIKTPTDLYKTQYGDLIKLKDMAQKYNIELAIKHPSLTDQPDMDLKILTTVTGIMDARTFVISPNFYSRMPREQAVKLVVYKINEILGSSSASVKIGVETTGRTDELGSLEDVIDIAKRSRRVEPILNWGNIHARGVGALRTEGDFKSIISKVAQNFGNIWLNNAYFLFSGVSYGPSGKIKNIPLARSDIKLEYLIKGIMSFNIKGTIIFEDPDKERFILKILDSLANMVR